MIQVGFFRIISVKEICWKTIFMNRAIVLGCSATGLGIIHALSKKGIKILAIPTDKQNIAQFSRFVSAKTNVISPGKDKKKLLDCFWGLEIKWNGSLLIVDGDAAIDFVAEYRKELAKRFMLTIPDPDVIRSILNKGKLYKRAKKNNIPIPKVLFPDSVAYLQRNKAHLTFPCIIKPFETHVFISIFKEKLFIINDFKELIEKFLKIQLNNLNVMVIEIIPGNDDCLYHYRSYIDKKGNILAEMCTQKLRQIPHGFGVARLSKTIPVIEELREFSLTLLKSAAYHGVSSAEYKYDYRDSKYKLMEINVRPVRPERLFFAAGINFPFIAFLDCVKNISFKVKDYKNDIYWIQNFPDIIEFIKARKENNYLLKEYFKPYFLKNTFCIPFFYDPLPFIVESFFLLKNISKKIIQKMSHLATK